MQSIPLGLLIRIPEYKGSMSPLKSLEQSDEWDYPECAMTYLNYIIFT